MATTLMPSMATSETVGTLSDAIAIHDNGAISATPGSGVTVAVTGAKSAGVKYVRIMTSNTAITNAKTICTLPVDWAPVAARPYATAIDDATGVAIGSFLINPTSRTIVYYGPSTSDNIVGDFMYM